MGAWTPSIFVVLFVIFAAATAESETLGEILDLSWAYGDDTIYWPGVKRFEYTKKHAGPGKDGNWYSANEFCTGEHGGTHLDAPYHFSKNGQTVEKISVSKLIVPGVIVDVTEEVKKNGPSARLQPEHLIEWVSKNGAFPENSVLLVRFGWSQFYSDPGTYLGNRSNGELDFPGISAEAASWIVNATSVVGVGVDTASADPGRNHSYEAHRTFAENQLYILENVNIPSTLPPKGFTLLVLPMKLAGGSGAPVRIVAVPQIKLSDASALVSKASVPMIGHVAVVLAVGLVVGTKMIERWLQDPEK